MSAVEEWRTVGIVPDYEVSNLGRVRSLKGKRPRVLKPWINPVSGYPQYTLWVAGRPNYTTAHALVATAFIGPRPPGMDVRHLDGQPTNNRAENLRYGTRAENMQDKRRHGTNVNLNKTHCPADHPYDDDNTYVVPSTGARQCRTCMAEATRRYRAKRVAA